MNLSITEFLKKAYCTGFIILKVQNTKKKGDNSMSFSEKSYILNYQMLITSMTSVT